MALGVSVAVALLGVVIARSALQPPAVRPVDEKVLREYAGVYRWEPDAFVYLQLWQEFSGFDKPGQLTAFDEAGDVRTLYPTDGDQFFAGPGAAVSTSIESRIEFHRDATGRIISLIWRREGVRPRTAARIEIEKHEDVRFSSGDVQLAGTLISPIAGGRHPAIILVHGSGADNREYILPFARFLIRRGIAVLGYDKRGVDGSTGDWNTASFDDLAGDVVAAFEYLKTRGDIDPAQIGLLGLSQAGWIMPLAAVRARDIAFLISISGAGVPGTETTIDHAQNEMTASGMKPQTIAEIVGLMKAVHPAAVLLRSGAHTASASGADTGTVRGTGQQHPRRKEQSGLGRGTQSGWEPGLHAANSAESESWSVRSSHWEQRRNAITPSLCAGVRLYDPGVARETRSRLSDAMSGVLALALALATLQAAAQIESETFVRGRGVPSRAMIGRQWRR